MSSTYRVLCLSHDPAIVAVDEVDGPEGAASAIVHGVEGHEGCDLMMGRYSYPLVELGCPGNIGPCKRHSSPVWADIDWLRLIVLAHQQPEGSPLRQAARGNAMRCFTAERLHRLRSQREDLACPPVPATPEVKAEDEAILAAVKALYSHWVVVLHPDGKRLLGELYGAVVHSRFPYEPPPTAWVGQKLTSRDPEPPAGTVVVDGCGVTWLNDGHRPCCWVRPGAAVHDPETWNKIAGNYGPVTVLDWGGDRG